MDPKPRPNDEMYFDILRRMTPQERLEKAVELSLVTKEMFLSALRRRYPERDDAAIHSLALEIRYPWIKQNL